VYERGSRCVDAFAAAASAFPHSPQNLIAGAFSNPQLAHFSFSEAPHSPQNFMPLAFSKPRLGNASKVPAGDSPCARFRARKVPSPGGFFAAGARN
jgi:hypothetical protein